MKPTVMLLAVWHTCVCFRRVVRKAHVSQVFHDRPDWFVRATAEVPMACANTRTGFAVLSAARYEWAMRQVVGVVARFVPKG